jgi:hypothetical protein
MALVDQLCRSASRASVGQPIVRSPAAPSFIARIASGP